MDPSTDLAVDLPPPRDDEPASLRQDIVDELADHLECALHRELLRGGSSGPGETAGGSADSSFRTAPKTVLTRFGNPDAVAHRLWLDAMKKRLMAQKITTIMATVAALACVALAMLIWRCLEEGRQSQAALLAEQQQFNSTLLKVLRSMQAGTQASESSVGWTPLKVRLVAENLLVSPRTVSIDGAVAA